MERIVIVGAGQAGFSAAATLRKEGYRGALTLIGEEPDPPYQRPPLSKDYLLGKSPRERLYLRPQKFYAENDIHLLTGRRVSAIDPAAGEVVMGDGRLGYDRLILATGARPRTLPQDIGGALKGVHSVRTLADIDRLSPGMTEGQRVAIIGGGYIGLEAAAVAAQLGMRVTVIEASERILRRVACCQTSDYIRALHRAHGVEVIEGTGVADLTERDGRLAAVRLDDGTEIGADTAIVGIGVAPETEVAESAGILCENGIRTDAQGRTNMENIWAAGDCASFPWRDGRFRLESVPNAIDHAETVARNILGHAEPYTPDPWFWSDQYDLKMQIAGLMTGFDDVVMRDAAGRRSHWYFKGDHLQAVDSFSDPASHMVARRLLRGGVPVDKAALADTTLNLKSLL